MAGSIDVTRGSAQSAIRKTETAEVRVSRNNWKMRDVVDIRVWFLPPGGGAFIPSRKGLTIDASKLPELIDALREVA